MDFYKPICKHIVIPLWAWWEDTPYLKHLEYLEKSQYFSEEKIKEIQWSKITQLLHHAYNNCKYYKDRFDADQIHPGDIKSFKEFASLPILKKEDVHQHQADLIAPAIDKYKKFLTSGSTGKPLSGYINKDSSEFKRACGRRSEFWAGYDLGERIYCLYGNPEKEMVGIRKFKAQLRRKYLSRTEILDLLTLTDHTMLAFAEKMRRKKPSLLWGHAHALYVFAKYLEKKGILDIRPKGIFSAGMVLHDWERVKIQEVFQTRLQDRYGCEELGLIATECKAQEGLHINTDVHYVEFLKNNGEAASPGESGYIVITDLTNYVMPFIRYRMEDIGILSTKKCSCGRTQPLIEKIEGRTADFLITPEGKMVSGISLTDHFAGHIPGVAQIQIIQDKIDNLTINIVKDISFNDKSINAIRTLVKEYFGEQMKFYCEFKNEIPREPSGKTRFTIRKIEHDLLQ